MHRGNTSERHVQAASNLLNDHSGSNPIRIRVLEDDVDRNQKAAQVFQAIMKTPDKGVPGGLLGNRSVRTALSSDLGHASSTSIRE